MDMHQFFRFPDPANETSARLVALGVVVQAVAFLLIREGWLLVPLVYGFAARVLTGPTASPLGQFSVRVATPFVERRFDVHSRLVPGPPKRFAQAVGLAVTAGDAFWIGVIFTAISLARSYVLRRWFNGLRFGHVEVAK